MKINFLVSNQVLSIPILFITWLQSHIDFWHFIHYCPPPWSLTAILSRVNAYFVLLGGHISYLCMVLHSVSIHYLRWKSTFRLNTSFSAILFATTHFLILMRFLALTSLNDIHSSILSVISLHSYSFRFGFHLHFRYDITILHDQSPIFFLNSLVSFIGINALPLCQPVTKDS